jgi:small subunit ribosomal protein S5e
MRHGRNNGKKLMAMRIVKHAFEIIHLLTDLNPIQVVVDAIVNTGPREDSTRIGSAGTVRRQAVDVSPLRRVNQAIWLLTTGAREASFRTVKTIAECLADELINAAKVWLALYCGRTRSQLFFRVLPTATLSRRRMSWSALPSPTVKINILTAFFIESCFPLYSNKSVNFIVSKWMRLKISVLV